MARPLLVWTVILAILAVPAAYGIRVRVIHDLLAELPAHRVGAEPEVHRREVRSRNGYAAGGCDRIGPGLAPVFRFGPYRRCQPAPRPPARDRRGPIRHSSPLASIRQLGFALVIGLTVDALFVRPVLVPCGNLLLSRLLRHQKPPEASVPD